MKPLDEIKQQMGLQIIVTGADGGMGKLFLCGTKSKPASVVFSWGGGWEHVSVSFPNRTPTWDEMCRVKDIFWNDDECVVQYHPPKSEYVNFHPYCLHLWRKIGEEYPMPPKNYV
ncbi:MAG: hypothetical protein ACI4YB_01835 [Oscillospiraceae bacterium]